MYNCLICEDVGIIEIHAECDASCDDQQCPYIHVPYTEKCKCQLDLPGNSAP